MDFIVSYAPNDRAWAEWVAWQLGNAHYSVEIEDSIGHDDIAQRVESSLARAGALLLVLSHDSIRSILDSPGMERSLRSHRERLVVARVDDVLPTGVLQEVERVDFARRPEDGAAGALLDAVVKVRQPAAGIGAPSGPRAQVVIVFTRGDEPLARAISREINRYQVPVNVTLAKTAEDGLAEDDAVVPGVFEADVVVPIVSRDFLATGYGHSREMRELVRQHRQRRVVLIPVIAHSSSWRSETYGPLPTLPRGGVPVTSFDDRNVAVREISRGVELAARQVLEAGRPQLPDGGGIPFELFDLRDVFMPVGAPTHTFVEPDYFAEFCLALQQPGLGVVLEGPSGIGKTTILKRAIEREATELGAVTILTARSPSDVLQISELPGGHSGVVAVDDFHRLSPDLRARLANYAKLLADEAAPQKLVIVGIPGTARHLIDLSPDLVLRIRFFEPEPATDDLVVQMIEKGESALNVQFLAKSDIVRAAAGSLQAAQNLCWQLAGLAGVRRTMPRRLRVDRDLAIALKGIMLQLALRYGAAVRRFSSLDGPDSTVCIDLLLQLGNTNDGVLGLADLAMPVEARGVVQRVFFEDTSADDVLNADDVREHLFFDRHGRRLISDDPQFLFYVRHVGRDTLMTLTGKRGPTNRTNVFVCYSHKDRYWYSRLLVHLDPLERAGLLEVWSDTRIQDGSDWRPEITAALAAAHVAILLVSADMLASDFIRTEELPRLLKRAEEGGCRIIPLLVGPSAFGWTRSLNRYQSPNTDGRSLSELTKTDAEVVLRNLGHRLATLLNAGKT